MRLIRWLLAMAADVAYCPPARQPPVHLKVASWSAPAGTPRLRTDSEMVDATIALFAAYHVNRTAAKLTLPLFA
jgi:hypothetical protein